MRFQKNNVLTIVFKNYATYNSKAQPINYITVTMKTKLKSHH